MNEFDLINNYFATQIERRNDVLHGIGDDAAIIQPPAGNVLAITTDTLNAGIHFLETALPFDIGYKSLAVNLSDVAAMGATPAWVLLALTLPKADEDWIQSFCDGFFTLANRYHIALIGGDLTQGHLSITVQAIGFVPQSQQLLRSGAKPGDLIFVTGNVGDAALALKCLQQQIELSPSQQSILLPRLNRPEPRVQVGEHLRNIASAAIDISDGLAADLNHLLTASGVGAWVYVDQLPLSPELKERLPQEAAIELALTGGDDYELCFTVSTDNHSQLEKSLSSLPCRYTCIGTIKEEAGLILRYKDGKEYHGTTHGYKHFK